MIIDDITKLITETEDVLSVWKEAVEPHQDFKETKISKDIPYQEYDKPKDEFPNQGIIKHNVTKRD
jgi:hypothetical protein